MSKVSAFSLLLLFIFLVSAARASDTLSQESGINGIPQSSLKGYVSREERFVQDVTVAGRSSSRLRRTNDRSVLRVHEDHEDDENAEIGVRQQSQDERLQLISLQSFEPDLILSGDKFIFKTTSGVEKTFSMPVNTYLEASLESNSSDNDFFFKITNLISESGSKIPSSGAFKLSLKKQEQNLENSISENCLLRTSSNVVLSSLSGTLKTLEYGGLPLILLSDGFSAVAGAGLGAVSGVINSFAATPQMSYSQPSGSLLRVQFLEPIRANLDLLSTLNEQVLQPLNASLINLDVKLMRSKKFYSYNFGDSLFLELKIDNASAKNFDLQDFVLVDKTNSQEFLPNPLLLDFNSQELSQLDSDTTKTLKLCYSLGKFSDDFNNYKLQIFDPITAKHMYYLPIQI